MMCVCVLQARTVIKQETIVTSAGEGGSEPDVDVERLAYARIDGPGPVLAYMADDKTHVRLLPPSLRPSLLYSFTHLSSH